MVHVGHVEHLERMLFRLFECHAPRPVRISMVEPMTANMGKRTVVAARDGLFRTIGVELGTRDDAVVVGVDLLELRPGGGEDFHARDRAIGEILR